MSYLFLYLHLYVPYSFFTRINMNGLPELGQLPPLCCDVSRLPLRTPSLPAFTQNPYLYPSFPSAASIPSMAGTGSYADRLMGKNGKQFKASFKFTCKIRI